MNIKKWRKELKTKKIVLEYVPLDIKKPIEPEDIGTQYKTDWSEIEQFIEDLLEEVIDEIEHVDAGDFRAYFQFHHIRKRLGLTLKKKK